MIQFVRNPSGQSFVLVDPEQAPAVAKALRDAGLDVATSDAEIGFNGEQVKWIDIPRGDERSAMLALQAFTQS